MLLSAIVSELQTEVPAVSGVPSSAQYEQAVIEAVREFSRRCGKIKFGELNIVSGTAAYDLPDDFLKMVSLTSFVNANGVILSAQGIIPLAADFCEEYTVIDGVITFKPTPTYTLTRDYKYQAAWVLTGEDDERAYSFGDEEKGIVLIKAKQLASEKKMNAMGSSSANKYSLGAVSVDKGSAIADLSKALFALQGDFVSACDAYNGAYAAYGGA